MQLKKLVGSLVLATSLMIPVIDAQAQNLPGNTVQEATVNADVRMLFSLAAQVYPAFANGSAWYSYSGFTYRYFAGAGVYVGVNDGNVYLLGGPYGSVLTPRFTLSNALVLLQTAADQLNNNPDPDPDPGPASDFGNIYPVKGINDLGLLFTELTMTYYTKSNLFGAGLTTTLTLKALTPNQFTFTIEASNTPAITTAEITTDASGNVTRFIMNGFEWPAAQRQTIAIGLVSSMLLSLAGPETPMIKAAISQELQNPALTQKIQSRSLNGTAYSSLILEIADAAATTNILTELTDMGGFTIATRYEANIAGVLGSVTRFEITAAKPR